MIQVLPLLLRGAGFLGLGGLKRRGWISLAVVGAALIIPLAIPGIKAKLPFVGTEAKLERSVEKVESLQDALDLAQAERDSAIEANREYATVAQEWREREMELIKNAADLQRAAAERVAKLSDEVRRIDSLRVQQSLELNRVVSLVPEVSEWAAVPIPVDIRNFLYRSAEHYKASIGQPASDHPIRIGPTEPHIPYIYPPDD